jgi:hypothetical protein
VLEKFFWNFGASLIADSDAMFATDSHITNISIAITPMSHNKYIALILNFVRVANNASIKTTKANSTKIKTIKDTSFDTRDE